MRMLVIALLLSLPGCALFTNTTKFNPKAVPERFIESCFEICVENSGINMKVACSDELVFSCQCSDK